MNFLHVVKMVPLLSVMTLAVVAIFNIGYFSEVGLHFIGIVDLSNLAYSFGLLLPAVAGLWWLAFSDIPTNLLSMTRREDAPEKFKRFVLRFLLPIFGVSVAAGIAANYFYGWEPTWGTYGLLAVIVSFIFLVGAKVRFHRNKEVAWDDVGIILMSALIAISLFGRAAAYNQVHRQKDTYTFATRDVDLLNVRIVRSASSGFLVVVAKRLMFIPKEQIKFIRADQDSP